MAIIGLAGRKVSALARQHNHLRPIASQGSLDLAAPLNPGRITGLSFRRKSTCAINVSMWGMAIALTQSLRACAPRDHEQLDGSGVKLTVR
jgi:hypothetical protein